MLRVERKGGSLILPSVVLGVKIQQKAIFLTELVTMPTDDSLASGQPNI